VERIAFYAVIELAVRLLAMCLGTLFLADLVFSFVYLFQVFSFFVGFLFQNIQVTFVVFGLGVVAILVVCEFVSPGRVSNESCVDIKLVIPPWPMFNRHPVTWLPVKEKKEKQQ